MNTYRYGCLYATGLNLGDEMQSAIVRSFLPHVDDYYDGCFLHEVKSAKKIKLAIHGRFDSHIRGWPPSPDVEPLFISFALGEYALRQVLSKESIEYFKQHEPVGCRDHYTRDLLSERGVDAYFSGCVTMMLPKSEEQRTDEIILTDLDASALSHIPAHVLERATILHHGSGMPWEGVSDRLRAIHPLLYKTVKKTKIHIALGTLQQKWAKKQDSMSWVEDRLQKALELVKRYSQAKLVITSRLHATLPNLALGTSVIFVPRDLKYVRFTGLLPYMNAIQADTFKDQVREINFDNPAPNPKPVDELRDNLTRTIKEFLNSND